MIFDQEDYKAFDPEIWEAVAKEEERQQHNIELIASENVVSKAVMAAQGSILTNKYAEGYPGRRYYGGTDVVDVIESLAIERAKEIFGAKFANVQPHSGSQANCAAYMALIEPGDTVMGMDLSAGGHLTHGASVSFSGQTYNFVSYSVDPETELLDFDAILQQAKEVQPKLIVAGASAYSHIIDFSKFREIADAVGAKLMVDMAHIAGLVAAGLHPSPVPYADITTTTTHKTLRGPRGALPSWLAHHSRPFRANHCPCSSTPWPTARLIRARERRRQPALHRTGRPTIRSKAADKPTFFQSLSEKESSGFPHRVAYLRLLSAAFR